MRKKEVFASGFQDKKPTIDRAVEGFGDLGYKVGKGRRNMVRHISLDGLDLVIKSFRVPNAFNRIAYRHFRKSKARRSYEYACHLLENGFGTAKPVGYIEYRGALTFGPSYYISLHVEEDFTFRTLIEETGLAEWEAILRQFTRFTHRLHEHGILFLDHSPGNTLIRKTAEGRYAFFLVDLNRMRLGCSLSAEERMKNFARLSATSGMIEIMADEYASLSGLKREWIREKMDHYTARHLKRRARRKKLNKQLGKYR